MHFKTRACCSVKEEMADMKWVVSFLQAGRSAGGDKGKGKFSEKDVAMADVD